MKTLVKCKFYLMTLPAAILFMVGTAVSDNHADVSTTDINTNKSANRIEKTYNVNLGGRLTINSDIGDVEVQTTTQNTVKIVVTKKAKSRLDSSVQAALADFEVTFYATPSGVSIRGKFQRGRNYWRYWKRQLNQLDIRFLVTVPRRYNVDLNTQSSAGNIYIDDVIGTVQIQTSGGNLRFNGVKGPISSRSTAGEIILTNCQGMVDIKTSVGNIRAELTTQPQHQWTLQTSVGNITGILNSDLAVEIDARTAKYVGNLSTDLRVRGNKTSSRLRGTINGGGPLLQFRTSIGNIRLLRN